jgi:hypothetical protein
VCFKALPIIDEDFGDVYFTVVPLRYVHSVVFVRHPRATAGLSGCLWFCSTDGFGDVVPSSGPGQLVRSCFHASGCALALGCLLFPAWASADMQFSAALTDDSEIWGRKVKGRIWGCGAGPGPSGHQVDRIGEMDKLAFSAAIMAGFLGGVDRTLKASINAQLHWLYDSGVCVYEKQFAAAPVAKVLWRCSVLQPEWRHKSTRHA